MSGRCTGHMISKMMARSRDYASTPLAYDSLLTSLSKKITMELNVSLRCWGFAYKTTSVLLILAE